MNVGQFTYAPLAAKARRCVLSANTISRTTESGVMVKRVVLGAGAALPSWLRRCSSAAVGRPSLPRAMA